MVGKQQGLKDILKQIGEIRITKDKRKNTIIIVFWYLLVAALFFLLYHVFV
jgi:hypothetical protein